jgi:hypothetical protein
MSELISHPASFDKAAFFSIACSTRKNIPWTTALGGNDGIFSKIIRYSWDIFSILFELVKE